MSVPIAFKLSSPNDNDVIILTADMTLEAVQRTAYAAIHDRVPQQYFDEFGGDMEKLGDLGRMDDYKPELPRHDRYYRVERRRSDPTLGVET
ncbi:hypothetical protein GMDG_06445, partial [Pseudogymnoascus destructans 20631-21]